MTLKAVTRRGKLVVWAILIICVLLWQYLFRHMPRLQCFVLLLLACGLGGLEAGLRKVLKKRIETTPWISGVLDLVFGVALVGLTYMFAVYTYP